jgi:hypothetical protein
MIKIRESKLQLSFHIELYVLSANISFSLSTRDSCLEMNFCRDLTTFAEYGNFGPGSDTSNRVSWAKKLDVATVEHMASVNFINTPEQWIGYQPF